MSKILIKSEKLTPFGGIFPIMEKFDRIIEKVGQFIGILLICEVHPHVMLGVTVIYF